MRPRRVICTRADVTTPASQTGCSAGASRGKRHTWKPGELALVDREQVPRQTESERRLFLGQLLAQIPGLGVDQRVDDSGADSASPNRLVLRSLALGLLGHLERTPDRGHQPRAIGLERIERAGAHQRLDHASVDDTLVDAPTEVEQIGERAALRAARRMAAIADSPVPRTAPSP